jgi:hypothetical protein
MSRIDEIRERLTNPEYMDAYADLRYLLDLIDMGRKSMALLDICCNCDGKGTAQCDDTCKVWQFCDGAPKLPF